MLLRGIANTTRLAKVTQELSLNNLVGRYKQVIRDVDMNVAKELRLTGIKKY